MSDMIRCPCSAASADDSDDARFWAKVDGQVVHSVLYCPYCGAGRNEDGTPGPKASQLNAALGVAAVLLGDATGSCPADVCADEFNMPWDCEKRCAEGDDMARSCWRDWCLREGRAQLTEEAQPDA